MLTPARRNPIHASQSRDKTPRLHGGPGGGPLIEVTKIKNPTPKNTIAIAKSNRPTLSDPFIRPSNVISATPQNPTINPRLHRTSYIPSSSQPALPCLLHSPPTPEPST